MIHRRILAAGLCAVAAISVAGCGIQIHTPTSRAQDVAEGNGGRILQSLSEAALAARNTAELQNVIRTQDTGAYEEVESWAPGEFAEKRGTFVTAVYKTKAHKRTVTALAYASGASAGSGLLENGAAVYGCFSATLTPGAWETPTESVPCPDFSTPDSVTEQKLTPTPPSKPLPDFQSTPGG